jgi:hypothetical protein
VSLAARRANAVHRCSRPTHRCRQPRSISTGIQEGCQQGQEADGECSRARGVQRERHADYLIRLSQWWCVHLVDPGYCEMDTDEYGCAQEGHEDANSHRSRNRGSHHHYRG